MAALVVGLLTVPAKSSYDAQSTQINRLAADLVLLDHLLAQYGPAADSCCDATSPPGGRDETPRRHIEMQASAVIVGGAQTTSIMREH
jgi:hypothetical protein